MATTAKPMKMDPHYNYESLFATTAPNGQTQTRNHAKKNDKRGNKANAVQFTASTQVVH